MEHVRENGRMSKLPGRLGNHVEGYQVLVVGTGNSWMEV